MPVVVDLPPALVEQVRQDPRLEWVYQQNGEPVLAAGTHRVYLVGVRWSDGAGLIGWHECAGGYWRPDLRRMDGQLWQLRLNTITWDIPAGLTAKTLTTR